MSNNVLAANAPAMPNFEKTAEAIAGRVQYLAERIDGLETFEIKTDEDGEPLVTDELIEFAKREHVSVDWLLFGNGDGAVVTHCKVVRELYRLNAEDEAEKAAGAD